MKDIFKRIASMVVEVPEDKPAGLAESSAPASQSRVLRTIAQVVKAAPGPSLDEVHVPLPAAPPPEAVPTAGEPAPAAAPPTLPTPSGPCINESGTVDVQAIYAKAGLPSTPFTAEQAYQMIGGLPQDLPTEMKKQTVTVMLMAMGKSLGVSPETIVTDAARKVAALHSFVEGMSKQSDFFVSKVQGEISEMEQRIAQSRLAIETAQKRISDLQAACEVEATRLNEAAEFFSSGSVPTAGQTPSAPGLAG